MPIFDQGYQHWKGALSGHAWRWLAITRHGIRTQLKGRYVRLLLILAWMPALTLVAALAIWGLFEQGALGAEWLPMLQSQGITDNPQDFRSAIWTLAYSFFFQTELYFIMLLVTLTGPNLISLDLRYNALPLYLSRPVTRLDYFMGKLGVIAALVAAVAVLPAAAAYLLGVCFSLNLTVVRDTWRLLPASMLYGLVIVLSVGTLMLALSSLSRRSLYVGLTWVGLFLIGSMVALILGKIREETAEYSRRHAEQKFGRNQVEIDYSRAMAAPPPRSVQARSGAYDEADFDPPEDLESSRRPSALRADDARSMMQAKRKGWLELQQDLQKTESDAKKNDWRPLFSYTANLHRLGEAILNTDAAWTQIGRAYEKRRAQLETITNMAGGPWPDTYNPQPVNERRLAESWVPQYPWTWSAAVLAGLLALSLCILSTRVKSLDRLR